MSCATFISVHTPLRLNKYSQTQLNRNSRSRIIMMASPIVHVGQVPSQLGTALKQISEKSITERGTFNVAISGGSLPRLLAEAIKENNISIDQWSAFLADERLVPLDHPDSNYREILSRLPSLRLAPIDPSLSTFEAAQAYQNKLVESMGENPSFDAVLLGLGPDGHTCSLFPEHALLNETNLLVAPIEDSPKPPPQRVTLTVPVLNASQNALFVCTGSGKAPVVKDIIENEKSVLPGAKVRPQNGSLYWLLDEGAASELQSASAAM